MGKKGKREIRRRNRKKTMLRIIIVSSSCRNISTDITDPLSPLFPIVHCFLQVFRATPRILTELLYVGSSSSACFCSAMWSGVNRSTSLMSTSLLLQQSSACLVRLTLILFVIGGRWPYSCCFVGCSFQDLPAAFSVVAVKLFLHPFR